jgi:hypothetical protein
VPKRRRVWKGAENPMSIPFSLYFRKAESTLGFVDE